MMEVFLENQVIVLHFLSVDHSRIIRAELFAFPNLGINTPAWRLGIRYTPQTIFLRMISFIRKLEIIPQKNNFHPAVGFGFSGRSPRPHGPSYHVYQAEFSAGANDSQMGFIVCRIAKPIIRKQQMFLSGRKKFNSDHYFTHSIAASWFS